MIMEDEENKKSEEHVDDVVDLVLVQLDFQQQDRRLAVDVLDALPLDQDLLDLVFGELLVADDVLLQADHQQVALGGPLADLVAEFLVRRGGDELLGLLDVAVQVDSSVLDLAGVAIEGRKSAVRSLGGSKIVFSVCPVESPRTSGFLHGLHSIQAGEEL